MTIFDLNLDASRFRLRQVALGTAFVAESGQIFSHGSSGDHWDLDIEFENLIGDERREAWALPGRLNGLEHTLRVTMDQPAFAYQRSGAGGGTVEVSTFHNAGVLAVKTRTGPSWSGIQGWLKAGDFIEINGELKIVTDTIATDGGGGAIVPIWPSLHKEAADGSACDINTPSGLFKIKPGTELPAEDYRDNDWLSTMVFSLTEDLRL